VPQEEQAATQEDLGNLTGHATIGLPAAAVAAAAE
jgi:hypothetical protein